MNRGMLLLRIVLVAAASGCAGTARSGPGRGGPADEAGNCDLLEAARGRVFDAHGKIRPLTLSSDQITIAYCGTEGERASLAEGLRRKAGDEAEFHLHPVRASVSTIRKELGGDPARIGDAAARQCPARSDCEVDIVRKSTVGIEAGGGGPGASFWVASVYNCGLFHSTAGHYEYTVKAAQLLKLSLATAQFLGTATRDVDEYEWYTPAAHGQTPNDSKARIKGTPEQAYRVFIRWEQCQLKRFAAACEGPPQDRLYLLGYAVHGVQDVVFHHGMTNPEHSYRDHMLNEGTDCWNNERDSRATAISVGFLQRAIDSIPATCRAPIMATSPDPLTVTPELRKRTAGRLDRLGKPDRVGGWLPEYFLFGEKFKELEACGTDEDTFRLRKTWFGAIGTDSAAEVMRILDDIFAPPASDPCIGIYDD
jgi:hypothetical protein